MFSIGFDYSQPQKLTLYTVESNNDKRSICLTHLYSHRFTLKCAPFQLPMWLWWDIHFWTSTWEGTMCSATYQWVPWVRLPTLLSQAPAFLPLTKFLHAADLSSAPVRHQRLSLDVSTLNSTDPKQRRSWSKNVFPFPKKKKKPKTLSISL